MITDEDIYLYYYDCEIGENIEYDKNDDIIFLLVALTIFLISVCLLFFMIFEDIFLVFRNYIIVSIISCYMIFFYILLQIHYNKKYKKKVD